MKKLLKPGLKFLTNNDPYSPNKKYKRIYSSCKQVFCLVKTIYIKKQALLKIIRDTIADAVI
jgi:hypothetical protein